MIIQPPRHGMTFLEITACLLLLGLGMLSVIAMLGYAGKLSQTAIAAATAMETAQTILVDPKPIGATDLTDDGTTTTGYINGYYFCRTRNTKGLVNTKHLGTVTITAEIFNATDGRRLAILRHRGPELLP